MSDERFKDLCLLILGLGWLLFVGIAVAHSQELPDHPQPHVIIGDGSDIGTAPFYWPPPPSTRMWVMPHHSMVKRAEAYTMDNDHYLMALYGTLRSLDTKSTHDLLSNPCHCFKESDPIAPHTGNYAALIAFQAGTTAAMVYGHNLLVNHGHPKLARTILLIDIGSEAYAVGHNMSLSAPKPLPVNPVSPNQVVFK